jgi:hypothetical protein
MNSSDWAVIYTPLITELVKALFGLIFGKEKTKNRIAKRYEGGKHEGTHFDADNYSASGKLRF